MPFIIPCVKCRRKLRVQDRLAGKLIRCPGCQHKFVAPHPKVAAHVGAAAAGAASAPVAPPPPAPVQSPAQARMPRLAPRPVHAIEAGPPPGDTSAEPAADQMPRHPAARPGRKLPEEDLSEPARPAPKRAGPRQSSLLAVFVTLGSILLVTAILGLVCAWWINSKVQWLKAPAIPARR
jgi:hypothetical protein